MDLVLQGLMRKAAPAGQGETLLHQLGKHHPGQRLFIRHFKWEPEKKGGGAVEGRGEKTPSGAFLFVHLYQIHLSFDIQKGLFFFLCKRIVLFCHYFFC